MSSRSSGSHGSSALPVSRPRRPLIKILKGMIAVSFLGGCRLGESHPDVSPPLPDAGSDDAGFVDAGLDASRAPDAEDDAGLDATSSPDAEHEAGETGDAGEAG
jgi:hypothetical protein